MLKKHHFEGIELFDRWFRGSAFAAHRNWYPAMACEISVKFF